MIIEGRFSARIRKVNKLIRIDFKEIIRGVGGMEISANISSVKQGQEFLEKIDYEEAFTIVKSRLEYEIDDCTVCLDNIEKLGRFIEIERKIESSHNKELAYKECLRLLRELAPNAVQEKRKYGDLMQDSINN